MTDVPGRSAHLLLLFFVFITPAAAQNSPRDVLSAVVALHSTIPADARTAAALGTERSGSGVVIGRNDLVLTIGYLILEASSVSLVTRDGQVSDATIVAYDHTTGFGLVRAAEPLGARPMEFGSSADLVTGDEVLVVGGGGPETIQPASVVDRREFAGYWEYLLESAIFTAPPHRYFSGSALLDRKNRLVGIGSLIVSDAVAGSASSPGNMFVPIELLEPILNTMVATGRGPGPARPWIGVFTEEHRGLVFVTRVAEDGPAAGAGIRVNDVILAVDGAPVNSMAEFYRRMWAKGEAGSSIPLALLRAGEIFRADVISADRYRWLRLSPGRMASAASIALSSLHPLN